MQKFIIKCSFFLVVILLFLNDSFLPVDTYTYRPWEALRYSTNPHAYFYPNQELTSTSVGDLCYYTQFAVKKNENWKTDKLGYRNDFFVRKANVLLIGDSYVAGSSLPQDSTLTNMLHSELNVPIYNMAPASFSDFLYQLHKKVIEKPQTIIFSKVEVVIPRALEVLHDDQESHQATIWRDRLSRNYLKLFLKARLNDSHGNGIRGQSDSSMFFLHGTKIKCPNDQIDKIAQRIISYKETCDSMGINFIFLPMPTKESVYFDKIPLKRQPDFLFNLCDILSNKGVQTINTLEVFNEYRKSNEQLIYHLDDTHWNRFGVELISSEISKRILAH